MRKDRNCQETRIHDNKYPHFTTLCGSQFKQLIFMENFDIPCQCVEYFFIFWSICWNFYILISRCFYPKCPHLLCLRPMFTGSHLFSCPVKINAIIFILFGDDLCHSNAKPCFKRKIQRKLILNEKWPLSPK